MKGFFDIDPVKIKTKQGELELGKYSIVYANPPWNYYDLNGNRKLKYPTMSTKEIAKLPVKDIINKNALLFIWATFPTLPEVFSVISSWGFEYKTLAWGWVKTNKKVGPYSLFIGQGHYTRSNLEILLLGKVGKIKTINSSLINVIHATIERHSKKPDIFRQLIVNLCGDLPRIELFARTKHQGWDCWGNEVNSNIKLENQ